MVQVSAKLKREGKTFDILVDLDEALKIRKGTGNINAALITNTVFYNVKSGDVASTADLTKIFGTTDSLVIAEKIIKSGELEVPADYVKKEQNQKYKQAVDFLSKNAVDQNSRPYTPERIIRSLEEAKVNILNKPIEQQIQDIIQQLQKIIPIRMELKKIKVTIPAQHSPQAYGVIHSFIEKEEWLSNGDLQATINVPAGMVLDFYDKLNNVTHGSAYSEEVKK